MSELKVQAFTAKQFREHYAPLMPDYKGDLPKGELAKFRKTDEIVYDILVKAGEELSLDEIYDRFFRQEGKQYDSESIKDSVQENLKKLCREKKIVRLKNGIYKAL